MSVSSSNNIFDQVNQKADIVQVVSYFLGSNALTRKGKVYYALCPFHKDTHPSFRIDPQRNIAHCFTCNGGGNPISFTMKYAHLPAMEALKKVCEICSIPLPDDVKRFTPKPDPIETQYQEELKALTELKKFYQMTLLSNAGEEGRKYFEERKLPQEAMEEFGLGFAPKDPQQAIKTLRGMGYSIETLQRAGILSGGSSFADRYSSRVMFPLEDLKGRTVAFSGRKINDSQEGGKYINYPETPLFHKGNVIYHFAKARQTCKKDGFLYVVEGYMDAIAYYRAGINSVCALMGTALTEDNTKLLKSLGIEIRLCLDGDEPGQKNEEVCLNLFRRFEVPCRVVRKFKGAKDADELLTKYGKEEFLKQANRFLDPFLFFLGRALKGRKELLDPVEVTSFLQRAKPYFDRLSDPEKIADIRILAKVTSLSEDALKRMLASSTGKDETQQNLPDKEKKRPIYYPKKNTQRDYGYTPVNIVNPDAIVASTVVRMTDLMKEEAEASGIFKEMVQTESEILCALPFLPKGMNLLLEKNLDLTIKVYYALSTLFSDCFIQNPKKEFLTKEDFKTIQNEIHKTDEVKKEEETSQPNEADELFADLFDIDDGENRSSGPLDSLSDKEKEEALQILDWISLLDPSTIDQVNFERNVEKEVLFSKIYGLISESRRKYGKVDEKTMMTIMKLEKKNRIFVKIPE